MAARMSRLNLRKPKAAVAAASITDLLAEVELWPAEGTGARRAFNASAEDEHIFDQAELSELAAVESEFELSFAAPPTPIEVAEPCYEDVGLLAGEEFDEAWDRFMAEPMPAASGAAEILQS